MLEQVTKRICWIVFIAMVSASAYSQQQPTAKGGALGVRTNDGRKHFTLSADAIWKLDVKERFDASALVFHQQKLLTIDDRDGRIYELALRDGIAELKKTELFPKSELAKLTKKRTTRFDLEGLATDSAGNLYVSEEAQRLVFRCSPEGKKIEAIDIDFTLLKPYFAGGVNASFEGIAVGGNRLYLANERSSARIIVVDLESREIVESYFIDSPSFAFGGPHYSDLAFYGNRLFILNRNHRCIFEVDPGTRRVIAEYSFGQMEVAPDVAYHSDYPTGAMEGLAVDENYFWMVTDNNGKGHIQETQDIRPTLFRCKRPDQPGGATPAGR